MATNTQSRQKTDPHQTALAVQRLVARAGQLYSLPSVAMKVLELTERQDVDARTLKECIENDPALTGKLLRVVNSSLFGLTRQVSDLNQAIGLLGSKPLKMLVLGFSLPAGLFAGVTADVLAYYWRHTLTKAVAARQLSQAGWRSSGDEAFIAALLQDVGLLLLVQQLGEPYVRFIEKVIARHQELSGMEIASMGFDHVAVSASLLSHWSLPQTIVDAVAQRPRDDTTASPLAKIVYLAELLARMLIDGQSHLLGEILEIGRREAGMTRVQLDELVDCLEEKVQQLADVLRLKLSQGLDYRDVLVAAYGRLADVAAEAAEQLLLAQADEGHADEDQSLLGDLQAVAESVARLTHRASEPAEASAPQAEPTATEAHLGKVARASANDTVEVGSNKPIAQEAVRPHAGEAEDVLRHVTASVTACRQSRCPVSLMLVELDHLEELTATRSTEQLGVIARLLEALSSAIDQDLKRVVPFGPYGYAILLPGCERRAAVELGARLGDDFRRLAPRGPARERNVSLSIGIGSVALPPRNFPAADLLAGAQRCLNGSRASGGGVVKSIEIY